MLGKDRIVILSPEARVVTKGEDALMHNLGNGAWCRVSNFAAGYFAKEGGINLAKEAASLGSGDAVGMLRLAAELAEVGIIVEKGNDGPCLRKGLDKAYLIVTRRCNLGCPSCYMGDAATSDYGRETVFESIGLLRAKRPSKVYVTGGEPCMRDDLAEIVEGLSGMNAVLCTNGTMPDRIPFEKLAESGAGLQISLESCSSARHDALRGEGTHALAAKSARIGAQMGLKVEIVPTIDPRNSTDIEEMVGFAGSLGTGCHGSLLTSVGRGLGCGKPDKAGLLSMTVRYLESCLGRGEIQDDAVLEDIVPMLSKSSCGAGRRVVCFTGDAKAHPCHLLWDVPLESFDIKWSVDQDSECRACDVRYLCGGGCRAAATANGGHDPNCDTYREIYSAFAWNWDDSKGVRSNLSTLEGHADGHTRCSIGGVQGGCEDGHAQRFGC
ncbi:MAG TPA: radical SAM protein [Bacillota bacterium]|nr:radical SAM protein [Bacillota bacterium]HOG52474.1 radical SAM protein [Bacillota bacterium]